MRCARASKWMSLYLDEYLDGRRMRLLEQHLAGCLACRRDLAHLRLAQESLREGEIIEEPAGLTMLVMNRVAVYETARASAAAEALRRKEAQRMRRAAYWRNMGWRPALIVLAILVAFGLWARTNAPVSLTGDASRVGPNLLLMLATPGPYAVAWGVWLMGGVVMVSVFAWLAKADGSAEWRRAIADRLPQLW